MKHPFCTYAMLLLFMCICAPGCSTTATTAVPGITTIQTPTGPINVIDEKLEISIGAAAEPQFIRDNGGEVDSAVVRNYVSNLGNRLASVTERPNLPWRFRVLDSSVVNAFAIPGGKVFITRGLLLVMTNEAQLAAVLGHECGHVTSKHMGEIMTRGRVTELGIAPTGVAARTNTKEWLKCLGIRQEMGGGQYALKFSRDEEAQADASGVRYLTMLGFSPYGQIQVLQILKKSSDEGGHMEILTTHPLFATRIQLIEDIIARDYPNAADPNIYRFDEESFKADVTIPLSLLPPPRHTR